MPVSKISFIVSYKKMALYKTIQAPEVKFTTQFLVLVKTTFLTIRIFQL